MYTYNIYIYIYIYIYKNLPLSSISPLNRVIRSSIRITYVFEIIPLLPHTTILSPWFPFNKYSAYRILSIVHSSIYSSNCPSYISDSLVQRSPLPSLRNHSSHLLYTPILFILFYIIFIVSM